ncbi:MAG: hypothetical protein VKP57_00670 [Candidatus Sericytochromatia bacterium]|nr:hypothetical protein [Candidatus Sericytochromatia bacterium]
MIHLVRGEKSGAEKDGPYSIDEYDAAEWLRDQLEVWLPAELRPMNLTSFEGGGARVVEVQAALRTPSFFGDRVVIVRNCHWFSASGKDAPNEGDKAVLVSWLNEQRPEAGHLVLLAAGSPNKTTRQYKAFASALSNKTAVEHVFPGPNPYNDRATVAWLASRAGRMGLKLQSGVAEAVVARIGQDKGTLIHELDKLTAFADGRPVTCEEVDLLCHSEESEVFPVIEALLAFDLPGVLAAYDEVARQKHPLECLATMASVWRHYVCCKDLAGQRLGPDKIARQLKAHPFKVQKDLEALRHWSLEALVKGLEAIVAYDHALKRGLADDREGFHLLLARLVQLGRARARA